MSNPIYLEGFIMPKTHSPMNNRDLLLRGELSGQVYAKFCSPEVNGSYTTHDNWRISDTVFPSSGPSRKGCWRKNAGLSFSSIKK